MFRSAKCSIGGVIAALIMTVGGLGGSQVLAAEGPGAFVAALPTFTLKDPAGKDHTNEEFKGKPLLVLLSIPNVKQGEIQSRWNKWLKKKGFPEGVQFILIQDMAQSNVREKARSSMKKKFKPENKPVLLLDETGDVRKRFRVPQDETVVLIMDKTGKVIHSYSGKPTIKGVRALKKLLEKM